MSIRDWERQFTDWIRTPDESALVDAANFFDFRSVHGSLSLESLHAIIDDAQHRKLFLARMARNAVGFRPPLGLFRRIREQSEGIDLKKGGIIPIVALARMYALEHGIRERSTVDRLRIAADRERGISREGEELLREAFRFLLHVRLSSQLQVRRDGGVVSNLVHLEQLTPLERRHLKEAFVAIAEHQNAVSHKYATTLIS
jgi:CBS domain-containing protein